MNEVPRAERQQKETLATTQLLAWRAKWSHANVFGWLCNCQSSHTHIHADKRRVRTFGCDFKSDTLILVVSWSACLLVSWWEPSLELPRCLRRITDRVARSPLFWRAAVAGSQIVCLLFITLQPTRPLCQAGVSEWAFRLHLTQAAGEQTQQTQATLRKPHYASLPRRRSTKTVGQQQSFHSTISPQSFYNPSTIPPRFHTPSLSAELPRRSASKVCGQSPICHSRGLGSRDVMLSIHNANSAARRVSTHCVSSEQQQAEKDGKARVLL